MPRRARRWRRRLRSTPAGAGRCHVQRSERRGSDLLLEAGAEQVERIHVEADVHEASMEERSSEDAVDLAVGHEEVRLREVAEQELVHLR